MGSEMCIRDSHDGLLSLSARRALALLFDLACLLQHRGDALLVLACLLYTSDAADERSSVDLGGRRIIKKKTQQQQQ